MVGRWRGNCQSFNIDQTRVVTINQLLPQLLEEQTSCCWLVRIALSRDNFSSSFNCTSHLRQQCLNIKFSSSHNWHMLNTIALYKVQLTLNKSIIRAKMWNLSRPLLGYYFYDNNEFQVRDIMQFFTSS